MVDQEIDGGIRGFHIDAAELVLPEGPDFLQGPAGAADTALVAQPAAGLVFRARGAQTEYHLDLLARWNLEPGLDGRAGVQSRPAPVGQVLAAGRRGRPATRCAR